ncbi:amidohydrolase family protein [Nocardia sp. NPDC050435]|uniref:amidohydrolase family protein n=1 Tax=Nocardia sp. NPDC050435 TaxID=3155040 RepID=UPI0033CE1361
MAAIIRGGTLIDTDPVRVLTADLRIDNGRITEIGSGLRVPADAEVLDATGMLVLPGFVDAHRHTWQSGIRMAGPDISFPGYLDLVLGTFAPRYQPEDVRIGTLAGALECLDAGITTVLDWSHIQHTPDHTSAAVDGIRAAGIRAVFGYCVTDPDLRAARDALAATGGGLVTMAMAPYGPEIVDEAAALAEWRIARELDLPVTVHAGGYGPDSAARGLDFLRRNELLGPRTNYAHGNSYTDDQLKLIADTGGTLSVSPLVEAALGFGAPITARAVAAGVPTGLGADSVVSGPGDMFSLMRSAYGFARLDSGFSTRDALRAATVDGAKAAGVEGAGTLAPGSHADIVLLRNDLPGHDPVASVVLGMDTRAVDTVLVGGRIVKQGGHLVSANLAEVRAVLAASTARLTAAA